MNNCCQHDKNLLASSELSASLEQGLRIRPAASDCEVLARVPFSSPFSFTKSVEFDTLISSFKCETCTKSCIGERKLYDGGPSASFTEASKGRISTQYRNNSFYKWHMFGLSPNQHCMFTFRVRRQFREILSGEPGSFPSFIPQSSWASGSTRSRARF